MKQISKFFPILLFIGLILILFRSFVFEGKYPIPFETMVQLHFPFNAGGWDRPGRVLGYQGSAYGSDLYRQIVPWKQLAIEQLKRGEIPWWNPYNFSGEPLLANIQTTLFYPATILFFIFEFYTAWSLYILLAPLIAMIGFFLLARRYKLPLWGSILGAVIFAFNTRQLTWMIWGVVPHTGAWLPWLLLGTRLFFDKKYWKGLSITSFAFGATILGGYPQEGLYSLIVWSIFVLLQVSNVKQQFSDIKKWIVPALVSGGMMLIWISPQAYFTGQLYPHSTMQAVSTDAVFTRTRLKPQHLLTFFAPDYFGNRIKDNYWAETFTEVDYLDSSLYIGGSLVVIFLMLFWLRFVEEVPFKNPDEKSLRLLSYSTMTSGLLLATVNPFTNILGMIKIPLITTGAAVGALYMFLFGMALFVATHFELLEQLAQKRRALIVAPVVYLLLGCTLILVPDEFRRISFRNLVIPTAIAGTSWLVLSASSYVKSKKSLAGAIMAVLFFHTLELARQTDLIIQFSDPQMAFPTHQLFDQLQGYSNEYRSIGYWDAELITNLHTAYRIQSVEGYNPLHSLAYQQLVSQAKDPVQLVRSDTDLKNENEDAYDRLMQLLGIKYVFAKVTDPQDPWEIEPMKYDPKKLKLIWQQSRFKIYEYDKALPKGNLVTHVEVVPDSQERLSRLFDPSFDIRSSAIVEEEISSLNPQSTGSARLKSFSENKLIFDISVEDGPSFLVINDTYHPIWKAFIESEESKIYRTDHALRGIIVPTGEYTVTLVAEL